MGAVSARTAAALAALCLTLWALLLPGAASADGSADSFNEGSGPEFKLGKKGALQLTVSTEGQRVDFSVEDKEQSVSYEVRGRVAHGGIRANLGGAGKVDVDFQPSGPPEDVEPIPFCKGKPKTTTPGIFTGIVEFSGRNHFAHFHATRVKGSVERPGKLHCHIPGGGHKPLKGRGEEQPEEEDQVELAAGLPGRLAFVAVARRDVLHPFSLFAAISKEAVGRVHISRLAILVSEGPSAFSFDEGLTTATVAPPAPFKGKAVFRPAGPEAKPSWSGSLRVAFLDGTMALTGKGFKAKLGEPREVESRAFRVP